MSISSRIGCRSLGAILLLLAVGCGSRGGGLATVTGKVSFRGQPLRTGTIVFAPDAEHGTTGPPTWADIAADGSYQLKTGEQPGIAAGWYRITVSALEPAPAVAGLRFVEPRSLLPDKYRDPESSGLVCEVKVGKENSINFNLE